MTEEKQKSTESGKRISSGRRPLYKDRPLKALQVTLPEDMIEYAKSQEGGASAFIRLAIKEHMEHAPIPPAQLLPDPPVPLDDADQAWGRESARKLGYSEAKEQ